LMYYKVTGMPVYYNSARASTRNTCIELYLSNAREQTGSWEIDLMPSGTYNTKKHNGSGYSSVTTDTIIVGKVFGTINTDDSTGFSIECYIPLKTLYKEDVSSLFVGFAVIFSPNTTSTASNERIWKSVIDTSLKTMPEWTKDGLKTN
ncbi:MAG: hypothetical protein MJ072_06330, partial [Clostridia bacterium]|nr:hypothetical protein [Clostridia bacterium]